MRKTLIPLALTLAFGALSAQADIIESFLANTSSLVGTTGYLDFQFNPGPLSSQSATAKVTNVSGITYQAGSQTDAGGATGGPVPGMVTIANSGAYNDDNEGVKFGDYLYFTLDFGGSAITAPNGTATSGSSFAFSLFDSTDTNPFLTNDPNGFAAVVNVNTHGAIATTTPSSSTSVTPEPASWMMLGGGALALLGVYRRRKQ